MRHQLLLSGLIISAPGILCAQMTEQEAYDKLGAYLRSEATLLASIEDEASANAALPELKRVMDELKSLNTQIDEQQLWSYIENTPDIKQPLIETVERLFVELQRLEKAKFYSVQPLMKQLRPMLTPAS